jgi:hypothetical protein
VTIRIACPWGEPEADARSRLAFAELCGGQPEADQPMFVSAWEKSGLRLATEVRMRRHLIWRGVLLLSGPERARLRSSPFGEILDVGGTHLLNSGEPAPMWQPLSDAQWAEVRQRLRQLRPGDLETGIIDVIHRVHNEWYWLATELRGADETPLRRRIAELPVRLRAALCDLEDHLALSGLLDAQEGAMRGFHTMGEAVVQPCLRCVEPDELLLAGGTAAGALRHLEIALRSFRPRGLDV